MLCSKKRFQFTEQGDALDFLSWLLNALDQTLKPSTKGKAVKPTIIGSTLRGRMVIYSQKVMPVNITPEQQEQYATDPEYMVNTTFGCIFLMQFIYLCLLANTGCERSSRSLWFSKKPATT